MLAKKYASFWSTEALDLKELEGRMNALAGDLEALERFTGYRPDLIASHKELLLDLSVRLQELANDPESHYREREVKKQTM